MQYLGQFSIKRGIDFSDILLSAKYPGGYREDAIIGEFGLRSWSLHYSVLLEGTYVQIPSGDLVPRLDYIWNFFSESKLAGNAPFIIRDPYDRKDYLAIFTATKIDMNMVDHELSTTGLQIEQVFVKGVTFLADGSFGESTNTDEI